MLPAPTRFLKGTAALLLLGLSCSRGWAFDPVTDMATRYRAQVDRVLEVPLAEIPRYARLVDAALAQAGVSLARPQYLAVVDRDPNMQALLLLFRTADGQWQWVGASPVSTGRTGGADNFETPLGAFAHSPANADARSEGKADGEGLLPYGEKGLRIYDFGWQRVPKGWGSGTATRMHLRMHATDPDLLERRLGSAQSQGGIRIPAALNRLLDRYGVLDAEYEQAARDGRPTGVLDPQREPVAFPGRYLIVVDSGRTERPEWNPRPFIPHRKPASQPAARSGDEHGRSVHAAVAQGLDGRVGVVQREGLHMGAQR